MPVCAGDWTSERWLWQSQKRCPTSATRRWHRLQQRYSIARLIKRLCAAITSSKVRFQRFLVDYHRLILIAFYMFFSLKRETKINEIVLTTIRIADAMATFDFVHSEGCWLCCSGCITVGANIRAPRISSWQSKFFTLGCRSPMRPLFPLQLHRYLVYTCRLKLNFINSSEDCSLINHSIDRESHIYIYIYRCPVLVSVRLPLGRRLSNQWNAQKTSLLVMILNAKVSTNTHVNQFIYIYTTAIFYVRISLSYVSYFIDVPVFSK